MIRGMLFKIIVVLFILNTQLLSDKGDFEKVSLQLQWKHQFQFAGYYMAKEKGFYKKAGLKVDIKELNINNMPIDNVLSNKATYGVGRSSLVINRSNGKKIQLLSAIFQSSPSVLLALKSSSIKTIKDFTGKRIMITPDEADNVALQAMAKQKDININNMIIQKHSFNINDLINGKTDLMSSYISNEPFLLKEKGIKYTIFDPKDYNFDFYSDILFTSEDEITNNMNRAIKFKDASLKGWEYAFNHIEETVNIILKKYNTQNKSKNALVFEANKLKELAYYKTKRLGDIDKNKMQRIYDIYNVMGLIKNKIDLDKLIYRPINKVNTLTYDETNYIQKNKIIKMCNNNLYEPIEFAYNGNQNNMRGIALDTLSIIEKKLDIKFVKIHTKSWKEAQQFLKDKKCDILPAATKNSQRIKYANFTKPYLKLPLAILANENKGFVSSLDEIVNKKILRHQGSGLIKILQDKYPSINIVETKSIKDSFFQISKDKSDYTIATIPIISSVTSKYMLDNIHIAGYTNMVYELGIAVRDDDILLLNILNKALESISKQQHNDIYQKWVNPIIKEKTIDYIFILQIAGVIFAIFSMIIYWNLKLSKVNKKLKDTQKELEILASVDSMTQLYNRRYFTSVSEHVLSLAQRDNTDASILILDIDKFKNINDTYGHSIGDEVIKSFANSLERTCRKSDILCRWGGEEFMILLPETSTGGAKVIAEKIRQETENLTIELADKKSLNFTVSIGISLVCNQTDINLEPAISRADKALYEAKNNGRNQVCIKQIEEND